MTKEQWKRIGSIEGWLFLFPPWGLYLLWRDTLLDRATKWRVAIYSVALLVGLSLALMIYTLHAGEKMIAAAGGGF